MNAKQAARAVKKAEEAAKKAEEAAKNPVPEKTKPEQQEDLTSPAGGRERLPEEFEKKYTCEALKEHIADTGMWCMIPGVNYHMDSPKGIERLKKNDVLFTFIDQYFQDMPFAFEPNMRDGRFVFLPADVSHQGIGICASAMFDGFLDVGHFWYPAEFTRDQRLHIDQVFIPQFSARPDPEFAQKIKKLYSERIDRRGSYYCTFPFAPDCIVRLKGNFMDDVGKAGKAIREALKDQGSMIQKHGEQMIHFMHQITEEGAK